MPFAKKEKTMNTITAIERLKREWVYLSSPNELEFGACPRCGGNNLGWSNYYPCVWCFDCVDDVIPTHHGILDGPVMPGICKMMGISFDAFDLLTHTVVPFESEFLPNGHLKNPTEKSPFV